MAEARIIHRTIAVPFDVAYGFAQRPESFPLWAKGLSTSLEREGGDWVADTPAGRVTIRFSPPNPYGVLDHTVVLPDGAEVYVPFRMVANGEGTEAELVLFRQPGMDDAAFDRDAGLVAADLDALKALLEARR